MPGKVLRDEERAFCYRCGVETNHDTLHDVHVSSRPKKLTAEENRDLAFASEAEWPDLMHRYHLQVEWRDAHQLIKCRGCDNVTYRLVQYCSEWGQDGYFQLYPPRSARRMPSWVSQLKNRELEKLIEEIYSALQIGCNRLVINVNYFPRKNDNYFCRLPYLANCRRRPPLVDAV